MLLIVLAMGRVAAASPELDHVLSVPTAWLPHAGDVVSTAGLDHHGDGLVGLGVGLGGISEVELGVDSETRVHLARAAFRLGARENEWFTGQPALVFGVRTTIGTERRAAEAYVVASKRLGLAAVHAGAAVSDAESSGMRLGMKLRPLVGAELTPPQYPKTTVMADFAWLANLEAPSPTLGYAFSWGVRYQALTWGSIELDVRQREGELGSPTVMVRINAVLGYAPPTR